MTGHEYRSRIGDTTYVDAKMGAGQWQQRVEVA